MKSLLNLPAPTFDDPLDMLMACHDRIDTQCATLLKLARHLSEHGADRQAQQAATNVLRYFDTAGQHHHDDEERDLFPVLLQAVSSSERANTKQLIDELLGDHQEMYREWSALREKLNQVRNGSSATISVDEAESFSRLYARHIAREESQLLPLAKRALNHVQMAALGRSMSRRRGAKDN